MATRPAPSPKRQTIRTRATQRATSSPPAPAKPAPRYSLRSTAARVARARGAPTGPIRSGGSRTTTAAKVSKKTAKVSKKTTNPRRAKKAAVRRRSLTNTPGIRCPGPQEIGSPSSPLRDNDFSFSSNNQLHTPPAYSPNVYSPVVDKPIVYSPRSPVSGPVYSPVPRR